MLISDNDVDADVDADDAVDNNYNEMMNSTELCELRSGNIALCDKWFKHSYDIYYIR